MPDGTQVDHHLVRMPRPAAGTVVTGPDGVLLIHRHRFITGTWGWEIPAGGVDPDETPAEAAARETREETGWEVASVAPLCSFHPANGLLDQTFHIFVGRNARHLGPPSDPNEADRIEWVPVEEVRRLLLGGEITDGLSFGAVSYWFAAGAPDPAR
jgi:8-oxo-dGTP pyrophosphatase MutT (NUDIX family)